MIKKTIKKLTPFLRYSGASTISFTLDLLIFWLLTSYTSINYMVALCMSYTANIMLNFTLCYFFVFHTPFHWVKAFIRHYSSSLINLFFQQIGMYVVLSHTTQQHMIAARVGIAALTFIINYFFVKYVAFKGKRS